jgi:MinD-like ATPase involved in chromosome partitioning or flagellar assembly
VTTGVLVALGGAPFEAVAIGVVGRGRTHVARRCVDIADLLATAASGQGDVALVSTYLAGLDRETVDTLETAGVAVVGVVATASDTAADALRRIGVESVVTAAAGAEALDEAIAAAAVRGTDGDTGSRSRSPEQQSRHPEPAGDGSTGRIVAVWGPTGAPGRTVVALGLGATIADLGAETLVVDADVYGGSVAQYTGVLDETSGLLAATRAANSGALDPAALAGRCLRLTPRLRVLTGLPRADRWVEAKAVLVRAVLDSACRIADHVVVDCGFSLEVDEEVMYDTRAPRRNGATIEILNRADTVVVVGAADPVGLSRLIRAVGELAETVPGAQPLVVVNRLRDSIGWSTDGIASILQRTAGVRPVAFLPDDPVSCDRALVTGTTLLEAARDRPLTRRLRELAADVSGLPAPQRRRRDRSSRQGRKSNQSPVTV